MILSIIVEHLSINVVVEDITLSGGIRVIFEYANRLTGRGHEVNVVYPLIPTKFDKPIAKPARLGQLKSLVGRTKKIVERNQVNWFDLDANLIPVLTLSPSFRRAYEPRIPNADVTIAGFWKNAYTVSNLPSEKGVKTHFVQHYEIWDIWNDDRSWDLVARSSDSPNRYPIEMADVTLEDPELSSHKEAVDESLQLPLHKITISSWLSELLEEKFDQDVHAVIQNSVNHEKFYYKSAETSKDLSLLIPYRHHKWKGKEEIHKLINFLMGEYPSVTIHLFAPWDVSDDLPSDVIFHKRPSDDELCTLYSKSDIFVLPSWVEGCQLPPLEAMACRCAVVATNVGGMPDYASNRETAMVVPPRDIAGLKYAVQEVIEDEHLREELKGNGYRAVNRYSWEEATDQFEQALYKLVE